MSTKSDTGATAVEYALLVGLIALAIIGAVTKLGGSTNDVFKNVTREAAAATVQAPGSTSSTSTTTPTTTSTTAPIPDVNIALGRPASMSSTYLARFAASLGTDGIMDDASGNQNFFHTHPETNAWWEVDLGAGAVVKTAVLWNRVDCCAVRATDVTMILSNSPFPAGLTLSQALANPSYTVRAVTGLLGDHGNYSFGSVNARYARVINGGAEPLHLTEVQIFGTPPPLV